MKVQGTKSPRQSFRHTFFTLLILAVFSPASLVLAQTTTFTYQGRFTDGGTTANGTYDMQFRLFDSPSVGAGNQIGSTIANGAVLVSNGVFTVPLDFGSGGFSGADRFLEIGVRTAGDGNAYTLLSPRQQLTSAVYAIRAGSATAADSATNATQLGGVAANQYVQTNDSRLTDARTPSAGSSDYIQNTTNQQAGSFNIGGNGKADTLTASNGYFMGAEPMLIFVPPTALVPSKLLLAPSAAKVEVGGDLSAVGAVSASHYNIGFKRVLSMTGGGSSTSVGWNAGTSGLANSFFGANAGLNNTTGNTNSVFGVQAGLTSTAASDVALFGFEAGHDNTSSENSFFGSYAGRNNSSGPHNSFFGFRSGELNTTGAANSFYGWKAGHNNTASGNSFFGAFAGMTNTAGDDNSFFGASAGLVNTTGKSNSFFGRYAGSTSSSGSFNSFFGESAGFANTTGDSNSFFGQQSGYSNTAGHGNVFFGTGTGSQNETGDYNTLIGSQAGFSNKTGSDNAFVGADTGFSSTGHGNAFFGRAVGLSNKTGSNNTLVGYASNVGAGNLFNATAIGARAQVAQSNSIVLGGISGVNGGVDTNVGIGTTAPSERLTVKTATSGYGVVHTDGTITVGTYVGGSAGGGWFGTKSNHSLSFFVNDGSPSMTIDVGGTVKINTLGSGGSDHLCYNALKQISACGSSLRYKTNIQPFISGLSVLDRLRPITFDWKQGGMHDLGFGAEEIAAVEPLLVTRNDQGQVEGVKYDRITAVLVNAVKEQQQQIAQQQVEINELKQLIRTRRPSPARRRR